MTFVYVFGAGVLVGGALSYLFASAVIADVKALVADIKKHL